MKLLEKLQKSHAEFNLSLPKIDDAKDFLEICLSFLFPHHSKSRLLPEPGSYNLQCENIKNLLTKLISSKELAQKFMDKLESIYDSLMLDADAIFKGDPAAESIDEVITAYPGFFAIAVHRIAHELYLLKIPILPRILSEYSHRMTGIDIHPGAKIGKNFCIDHGTGIVCGETAILGDNVKIYQGVTLGALSVQKNLANNKRHPTIEDNVVIYANATILGGDTVIGKNSVIGGNVWITGSVPEKSVVYTTESNKIKQV